MYPQDLNSIGFLILSLRCTNLGVAIYALRIPAAPEPHSASEMRTTIVSLRYRIEKVQVS